MYLHSDRYSADFKALLLKRWENEGKDPRGFERKVWRWLTRSRSGMTRAEAGHQRFVENWAHNRTENTSASDVFNQQVVPNIRKGKLKEHAEKRRLRALAQGE